MNEINNKYPVKLANSQKCRTADVYFRKIRKYTKVIKLIQYIWQKV